MFQAIPLTRFMGITLLDERDDGLILGAPLHLNVNDKGTAFAGSLSALIQVTGWELWRYWLEQTVTESYAVAAVDVHIHYQKPVISDFQARAILPAERNELLSTLLKRGRCKVETMISVRDKEGEKAQARVSYALLRR